MIYNTACLFQSYYKELLAGMDFGAPFAWIKLACTCYCGGGVGGSDLLLHRHLSPNCQLDNRGPKPELYFNSRRHHSVMIFIEKMEQSVLVLNIPTLAPTPLCQQHIKHHSNHKEVIKLLLMPFFASTAQ